MKFTVDIGGVRHTISLDGGQATVEDIDVPVSIQGEPRDPVRIVRIGDAVHRVVVRRGDARGRYTLWVNGVRHEVDALDERTRSIRDLAASAAGPKGPAPLIAPMPGMIVRVNIAAGDRVTSGTGLVVMEAMKMENELRASADGVVRVVHVVPGQAVEKGMTLVELE